jgi:DNA modification methylase
MADRKLSDIFVVPPISVLDIRQKYWKDRRKFWLSLGIQSELGRNENLLSLSPLLQIKQKATSIFDPVLCEIIYKWFSGKDDIVFDPFAGGSVRGIVASILDRNYIGIDLRKEQIEHNNLQANNLCLNHIPTWLYGSSIDISVEQKYDLFFTCPPYYDLEKYSNDDKDLSNMSVENFEFTYENILEKSLDKLENDRFAAIVVGDVRDENGNYRKFPQKTINIFEKYGCKYYNDLILLQEPATAAMRSFNYMNSSRKIAKAHQNVLVFIKGDAKKATERLEVFQDSNSQYENFFI